MVDSTTAHAASDGAGDETARTRYLSAQEAADYLNVSVRFVRRAASARRLRHFRVGKFVRFDPADLDAFASVREPAPGPDPTVMTEVWLNRRGATP